MNNKNIVLIGMPSSGKTTLSKLIKRFFQIDYEIRDTDSMIEEHEKMTITKIFKRKGEIYFRSLESIFIKNVSLEHSKIISTGGGVILNPQNMSHLQKTGIIIFIDRPIDKIISNIKGDTRPLISNKIEMIEVLYKERIELYRNYSDYILKNETTLDDLLTEIESILKKEKIIE